MHCDVSQVEQRWLRAEMPSGVTALYCYRPATQDVVHATGYAKLLPGRRRRARSSLSVRHSISFFRGCIPLTSRHQPRRDPQ